MYSRYLHCTIINIINTFVYATATNTYGFILCIFMYWHYQHEAGSSTRVGSSDASDVFWSSRCKNNIRGFHESSPQKCTSYRILVRVGVLRWQSYSSSELPKRHLGWWKLSEWNMIQANPHPFSCPSRASLLRVKALRPSKILASNSTAGAPGAVPLANQGWAIASWLWKHRSIEASKHQIPWSISVFL